MIRKKGVIEMVGAYVSVAINFGYLLQEKCC